MKEKLIKFFTEFLEIGVAHSGAKGYGNPTSSLVEYCKMVGLNELVMTMLKIMASETWYNSNEYRLNGAGLKMLWSGNLGKERFRVVICGDQTENYPSFVAAAKTLIGEYGFDKDLLEF